jgi:hypothetical protein
MVSIEGTKEQIERVLKIGRDRRNHKSFCDYHGVKEEGPHDPESFYLSAFLTQNELSRVMDPKDWYQNTINIIGSKWIPSIYLTDFDIDLNEDDSKGSSLTVSYDSAWGPCVEASKRIFESIENLFEDVSEFKIFHSFVESGMQFAGLDVFSQEYICCRHSTIVTYDYLFYPDQIEELSEQFLDDYGFDSIEDLPLEKQEMLKILSTSEEGIVGFVSADSQDGYWTIPKFGSYIPVDSFGRHNEGDGPIIRF